VQRYDAGPGARWKRRHHLAPSGRSSRIAALDVARGIEENDDADGGVQGASAAEARPHFF
jgi:hypothetical protein